LYYLLSPFKFEVRKGHARKARVESGGQVISLVGCSCGNHIRPENTVRLSIPLFALQIWTGFTQGVRWMSRRSAVLEDYVLVIRSDNDIVNDHW